MTSTNARGGHLLFRGFPDVGFVLLLELGARDSKVILPVFTARDARGLPASFVQTLN